jgi:hypothetical protein
MDNTKDIIQSEKKRSMIGDSLMFCGIGTVVGLTTAAIFKTTTKYKIIFPIIGATLGFGVVLFLKNEKELKGNGAVTPDAKKDRNITFTKV